MMSERTLVFSRCHQPVVSCAQIRRSIPASRALSRWGRVGLFCSLLFGCGEPEDGAGSIVPASVSLSSVGPPSFGGIVAPKTADFDGDGTLDLVGYTPSVPYSRVELRLGEGDGRFGVRKLNFGEGGVFRGLPGYAAADFDQDGKTDLLMMGGSGGLLPPTMRSVRSTGSGWQTVAEVSGLGAGAPFLVVDTDGDLLPDLLSYHAGNVPFISKGDGTGRFTLPPTGPTIGVSAVAGDA